MNKILIIFLAVCLISVHALVKRDAPAQPPATNDNVLENLQKQASELLNTASEKLKEVFNEDEIKKAFNNAVDQASKFVNQNKENKQE